MSGREREGHLLTLDVFQMHDSIGEFHLVRLDCQDFTLNKTWKASVLSACIYLLHRYLDANMW